MHYSFLGLVDLTRLKGKIEKPHKISICRVVQYHKNFKNIFIKKSPQHSGEIL
jgi:hypothetical protein